MACQRPCPTTRAGLHQLMEFLYLPPHALEILNDAIRLQLQARFRNAGLMTRCRLVADTLRRGPESNQEVFQTVPAQRGSTVLAASPLCIDHNLPAASPLHYAISLNIATKRLSDARFATGCGPL